MREVKEREKMPALRIGEDSVNHARATYAEGTPERELFENVLAARIPYALMSQLTGLDHSAIRDMVTGRKKYTDEAKEKLCGSVNKLIDHGLNIGVYPCSDLAVIQPLTTVLLNSMANESRFNKAKQLLIQSGVLPADS